MTGCPAQNHLQKEVALEMKKSSGRLDLSLANVAAGHSFAEP